jgi:uncharacterized membrane protein YhhN
VIAFLWGLVAVAAIGDWIGVALDATWSRWITKPGVMVALIAVVLVGADHLSTATLAWLVVAFALCLAGDVFLLLPERFFLAGLASFLLGHVAYIVVFLLVGTTSWWAFAAVAGAAALRATAGGRILASTSDRMRRPVLAYLLVISLMAIAAWATGEPWLMLGAALFVASDTVLGWNRFVESRKWMDLTVIVTYHLAQISFAVWAVTR